MLAPLLALALAACGDGAAADGDSEDITAADLGEHEEARAFMDGSGSVWLEGMEFEELRKLVDDLYAAGAKRVVFADIADIGEARVSAWLVAELPAGGARGEVLRVFNATWPPYTGEPPVRDRGQAFVDLALD